MDKIKLLVVNVQNAGVGKFRFRDPHINLQKNFRDDFTVDIVDNPKLGNKDYLSKYDAVFIQSSLIISDDIFKDIEFAKKEGLKIILDIDDYWRLPPSHALYRKMEKNWKILTSRLKVSDLITTTTKFLAQKVYKYNKNVVVIPNAINPKEKQFQPNVKPSDRIRVGWAGGSSHHEDLKLLRGLANHMITFKEQDCQMVMCGFNTKSRDVATGKLVNVDKPKVWMECEYIFTSGYFNLDDSYIHYLMHPKKEQYPNVDEQPYKRIWTRPIQSYGTCYNEFDIAVAPLANTEFNRMKSQLKVIEAGFHKKPLIISGLDPYLLDCKHGENAMVVPTDKKKAHKTFIKYAKELVLNESMRNELGEALYDAVKDKYDLNNVTKKRAWAYKKYLNK